MSDRVGTRAWGSAGNGALHDRDRRRLMAQAMLVRLSALSQPWRKRLGLGDKALARVDISSIRIPDSAVAVQAQELVGRLSAPWLVHHCMRTYLWGAILGQAGGIRFDEELFFVASALHDLGLTDQHKEQACAACFAVESARAAEVFAERAGWADERRDRLSEAISLHLNVRVGLGQGAEAHLLQRGATVDLLGTHVRAMRGETVQAVLGRYPRLDINTEMPAAMSEQAVTRPQSRAAFLVNLGFNRMIRNGYWRTRG